MQGSKFAKDGRYQYDKSCQRIAHAIRRRSPHRRRIQLICQRAIVVAHIKFYCDRGQKNDDHKWRKSHSLWMQDLIYGISAKFKSHDDNDPRHQKT